MPQQITPFLWFNNNAEEAVDLYVSLLPNSKIIESARVKDARPDAKEQVLTIKFQLEGVEFVALNGGPTYTFTPAISLALYRDTQSEIDFLWDKLLEGGRPSRCGWLTDKFGLSWQIVPTQLPKLLQDKDPAKAKRVMEAMMKMAKLDIPTLENAAKGT
jgi:predicted 3-demethylubiquinone-9 3-methyltransferase (glyoxalase superfamily)